MCSHGRIKDPQPQTVVHNKDEAVRVRGYACAKFEHKFVGACACVRNEHAGRTRERERDRKSIRVWVNEEEM